MTRQELDVLVDWAADEGWNPGLHDADIFWVTDPEGFVAAEVDGEMIGGGSIVSYDDRFGFMGFFIVAPAWRGRGLGRHLWNHRKQALVDRLDPGATIGMDGVFAMQPFYERGGFTAAGRDIRFEGVGAASGMPDGLVDAREVPFADLVAYDAAHFAVPRPVFLKRWISQPGGSALAAVHASEVRGFGVARATRRGYKVGPLFANRPEVAEDLFAALGHHARGEPIFLDVPEGNHEALALARRHGMTEVFGCARMYHGPFPHVPSEEVFGVTTFELG